MRRGYTLMEMLVVMLLLGIALYAAAQGLLVVFNFQKTAVTVPERREKVEELVWRVADSIRRAQLCTAGSCTLNSTFEYDSTTPPTSTSLTAYVACANREYASRPTKVRARRRTSLRSHKAVPWTASTSNS